ncbi:redoxin domain-containing protein [Candidatus Frankia alpina]|uniref:redoxin domain-containing protein n=1 Tax=Candidatus Frankia alpina TaxID=2699483 RepID=UPI001F222DE1|nr:redoxin domain-containing protein [Candidatus Frankia alpina]
MATPSVGIPSCSPSTPTTAQPVCTRQMCSYSAGLEVFADLGVLVWGISPQDLDRHEEFARQHSLGFPLLGVTYSDVDTIAEQVRKL